MIFDALFYGIMPWWIYEKKCHYAGCMTYWQHLQINLAYASRWIRKQETPDDIAFALDEN